MMMGASGADGGEKTATFDGSTTYLTRGADFTGNSNGTTASFSFWYRNDGATGGSNIYKTQNNTFKFVDSGGTNINVEGRTTAGTRILDSAIVGLNDTGIWHHVCGMIDMSSAANSSYYFDDVVHESMAGTFSGGSIKFADTNHAVGADYNGSGKWAGALYDFWLAFNVTINFDTTLNRRKFIDADGAPVDLGSDGSTPTGTAPILFLTGDSSTFATNAGTGGGMTTTGTLTDTNGPTTAGSA